MAKLQSIKKKKSNAISKDSIRSLRVDRRREFYKLIPSLQKKINDKTATEKEIELWLILAISEMNDQEI